MSEAVVRPGVPDEPPRPAVGRLRLYGTAAGYGLLLLLLIAGCNAGLALPLAGLTLLLLAGTLVGLLCRPAEPSRQLEPLPQTDVQPAVREAWLDNLKAGLTLLVIVHHSTCAVVGTGWYVTLGNYRWPFQPVGRWFLTVNQSYFMALFFFLSGLVTPGSFDRKGVRRFLRDKYKRLAVPMLCYTLILGPGIQLFISAALTGTEFRYLPDAGPTWYLIWLLIFSTAYALFPGEPLANQTLPGWPALAAIGSLLGLAQFTQITFAPAFIFMPITVGSLPFDSAFFVAGVLTYRHGWLDSVSCPPGAGAAVAGTVSGLLCFYVGLYLLDGPSMSVQPSNECGEPPEERPGGSVEAVGWLLLVTWLGVFAVSASLALLDCFKTHCNRHAWEPFVSNAFAAYLVHPLPVVLATWLFVRVAGLEVEFNPEFGPNSVSCIKGWVLVAGWLVVCAGGILGAFAISAGLRRIPGVRQFL